MSFASTGLYLSIFHRYHGVASFRWRMTSRQLVSLGFHPAWPVHEFLVIHTRVSGCDSAPCSRFFTWQSTDTSCLILSDVDTHVWLCLGMPHWSSLLEDTYPHRSEYFPNWLELWCFEGDVLWSYWLKSARGLLTTLSGCKFEFSDLSHLPFIASVGLIKLSDSPTAISVRPERCHQVNVRISRDLLHDALSRRSSYCYAENARHSSDLPGHPFWCPFLFFCSLLFNDVAYVLGAQYPCSLIPSTSHS